MSRKSGSKNKIPSKRDLTKVSLETIADTFFIIRSLMNTNREAITKEQKIQIALTFEKMNNVLCSGKKHL